MRLAVRTRFWAVMLVAALMATVQMVGAGPANAAISERCSGPKAAAVGTYRACISATVSTIPARAHLLKRACPGTCLFPSTNRIEIDLYMNNILVSFRQCDVVGVGIAGSQDCPLSYPNSPGTEKYYAIAFYIGNGVYDAGVRTPDIYV